MNLIKNNRRPALALALAAIVAAIAAAVALPGFAQDTSLWTYKGADRTQKLIDAAKKEGTLTLYTSLAQKDLPAIIEPFEQKYGIKVHAWRSSSENVLQRTVTEASANRFDVDAIQSTAIELESLHREKILQPIDSPYQKDLIPGALGTNSEWAATYLAVWVQAYNTDKIKKEDLPKTYEDLLQPKWKGKLGIEADVSEWYSTVALDMGEEKGIKFFGDLVRQNGISVRKGHSLLNNLVSAGEVPLALTVYNYMPETSKKKGAPVDWFVLDPAVAAASGVAVVRRAPHPNAALLFYEYMLSPEAQTALLSMNYVPTNAKVPSPLRSLHVKLVDPAVALDQGEKWSKSFDEVIKQGKR
jgi:iron(III) transport system substrate-binding protein